MLPKKTENRNRLEASLQDNHDQLFPTLFGDRILIEGASHNGIPARDNKYAGHINSYEKKYEKIYNIFSKAVADAKDDEEKIKILSRLMAVGAYNRTHEFESSIYDSVFARVLNEAMDKEILRKTIYKKNML